MDTILQFLVFIVVKALRLVFLLVVLMVVSYLPLFPLKAGHHEPFPNKWDIGDNPPASKTFGFIFRVIYNNTKSSVTNFKYGWDTGTDKNNTASYSGAWLNKNLLSFKEGAKIPSSTK